MLWKLPESISDLHNLHQGKTCLVLANGGSIVQHDLMSIPDDVVTIGMNISWLLHWSNYHVCLSTDHWNNDEGVFRKLAEEGRLIVAGPRWPVGLRLRFRPSDETLFSFDLNQGVVESINGIGSVAYVALQVACWLGCNNIYFVGLDLSGPKFTGQPSTSEGMDLLFNYGAEAIAEHRPDITVRIIGDKSRCTAWPKVSWPWNTGI